MNYRCETADCTKAASWRSKATKRYLCELCIRKEVHGATRADRAYAAYDWLDAGVTPELNLKVVEVGADEYQGLDPYEPKAGVKDDTTKPLAGILNDFSRALSAVVEVGTFGASKYSRGNWVKVNNGIERYTDAMLRHWLQSCVNQIDDESGLLHEAHLVWNALALLELKLREREAKNGKH